MKRPSKKKRIQSTQPASVNIFKVSPISPFTTIIIPINTNMAGLTKQLTVYLCSPFILLFVTLAQAESKGASMSAKKAIIFIFSKPLSLVIAAFFLFSFNPRVVIVTPKNEKMIKMMSTILNVSPMVKWARIIVATGEREFAMP